MLSHYLTLRVKKCAADLTFEHPYNCIDNDAAKAQKYPWHPDLRSMPTCNPVNCSIKHLLSISSNEGKFEYACALHNSMSRRVKEFLYRIFKIATNIMTSCASSPDYLRRYLVLSSLFLALIFRKTCFFSWPNLL